MEICPSLFHFLAHSNKSLGGRPQVFTQRSRTGTYVCLGRRSREEHGNEMRQWGVNRFNSWCFVNGRACVELMGWSNFDWRFDQNQLNECLGKAAVKRTGGNERHPSKSMKMNGMHEFKCEAKLLPRNWVEATSGMIKCREMRGCFNWTSSLFDWWKNAHKMAQISSKIRATLKWIGAAHELLHEIVGPAKLLQASLCHGLLLAFGIEACFDCCTLECHWL